MDGNAFFVRTGPASSCEPVRPSQSTVSGDSFIEGYPVELTERSRRYPMRENDLARKEPRLLRPSG